jgi:hydrogenase expression/formation protein HypC
MCLGIPGKVIEVHDVAGLRMGKVDFGGVRKEACLAYTPEVELGDYVIVHVGFAISRVDEDEAMKTLEILGSMGDMMEQELATMGPGMDAPAVEDDSSTTGLIAALRQVSAPAREPRPSTDAQGDAGGPVS